MVHMSKPEWFDSRQLKVTEFSDLMVHGPTAMVGSTDEQS